MVRKTRKRSQIQCIVPSSPPWIEPDDVSSYPPWIDLPRGITANILGRLDLIERIRTAYNVCITWRYVCQDYPDMWRVIHLSKSASRLSPRLLVSICRKAVYCSHGQLVDITMDGFCTDDLLLYIAMRCKCRQLQRLRIVYSTEVSGKVLIKVLKKFPMLNELYLLSRYSGYFDIEAIGLSCPMLNSFTYTSSVEPCSMNPNDDDAVKVAKFMPGLQHLGLLGNTITEKGVIAILDGCQQLESLDIRLCLNIAYNDLSEDTIERCHRQLRQVWLPRDSCSDHEFYGTFIDFVSWVEKVCEHGYYSSHFGWFPRFFLNPVVEVVENEAPVPSRPWIDLPINLTANIFSRLSTIERLMGPWEVCTKWRDVCRDFPNMWRVIHISRSDARRRKTPDDLRNMCRDAVDCSHGELVDITMDGFCTDWLLYYIANRCSKLQCLRIASSGWMTIWSLFEVVKKFPVLNELHLYSLTLTAGLFDEIAVATIGQSCPTLKSFTFHGKVVEREPSDDVAVAVAQNMRDLRHLCLIGNAMTGKGLEAILDGCQHLESLDIRKCFNLNGPTEDLKERCRRQIRKGWFPNDSCSDVEFYNQTPVYSNWW